MYDTILARSFSRYEQKKLGYGAMIGCLLIALSFCTVFKPYLGPLPVLNLRLSVGDGLKMLMVKQTSSSQQVIRVIEAAVPEENKIEAVVPAKDGIGPAVPAKDEIEAEIPEKNDIKAEVPAKNDIKAEVSEVPAKNDIKAAEIVVQKMELVCKTTEPSSDFCEINNGDIRIDGNSSTVYIASSEMGTLAGNSSWIIKPYARKRDETAMSQVRQWSVKPVPSHQEVPQCTVNHSVPAILFSLAGYGGNHFHAFTDIIVPLFLTSRQFNRDVQFLITNKQSYWIEKFQAILQGLSKYEIIDIDEGKEVHCFPHVIVGLKHHKEFSIDPSRSPYYSMKDFREFLRSSYSLKRDTAIKLGDGEAKRPRLLIISRKGTRSFTNGRRIVKMAKSLGYDLVVAEADKNMSRFAQIVNSCDVMMGVHGAGLTNLVFLPENAVFIQIVPFGGLEWLANTFFAVPAKDMKLRYLEYKIRKEESTLIQQYPLDHVVLSDPTSIQKQGWNAFKSVYLEKQNVKLDVRRFRPTLLKALELLHQ